MRFATGHSLQQTNIVPLMLSRTKRPAFFIADVGDVPDTIAVARVKRNMNLWNVGVGTGWGGVGR